MKEKSSPWIKIISLNPPSLQDNTADADRLIAALKAELHTDHIDIDLDLLKQLPELLRKWAYRARCIVFKDRNRYLLTGILYAFLLGTPLLLAIGYVASALTSLVVFTATHSTRGPWFWQLYFHRELVVPGQLFYDGTYWLLAKTTACAMGIAMIAYARGASPKDSSRAVSQGVTSTILWATLYVLFVHFVFAFLEFG